MDIEEVEATRFAEAFKPAATSPLWGPFLTGYDIDDFRQMRCFLTLAGRVGGANQRFGFEVMQTLSWDERYAPSGWDYERWGRPDVYVMERR